MGGPPQHSTWDPKPDAPAEVRGEFGPIATTVPGLSISELLPRTALVADKLCILRAVSTGDNAHSSSGYYMLTGRPHQPMNFENANPGAPNDAPSLGALLGRIGRADGGLPPARHAPAPDLQHRWEHLAGPGCRVSGPNIRPLAPECPADPRGIRDPGDRPARRHRPRPPGQTA